MSDESFITRTMISVKYLKKRKWISFFVLFYIIFWSYQVNIFVSKPLKNNPQLDITLEQVKSNFGQGYEALINEENEHRDETHEKIKDATHYENISQEQMKNINHGQRDEKNTTENHEHEKNTTKNHEQRKNIIAQKHPTFMTPEQKDLKNEGTISTPITKNDNFKQTNASKAHTKESNQQRSLSCEPEIVQTGPDYRTAKAIWKYKIVQWMPYQRKVVDGELIDTSMGEFWQVDNCLVVDHVDVENADAVVIPVMSLNPDKHHAPPKQYPSVQSNIPSQIRILLHNDHPYYISITKEWRASSLNNYFNWTMTYRSTSDVHVPYGYSFPKETPTNTNIDYSIGKAKMVSAMISGYHSQNYRMEYIRELERHIKVDMYGRHGIPCDGHYISSCELLKDYKFYLAFENSNCDEYVTEKMWLHGFQNNVLPIVMGASKKFYISIAPPYSFIHIEDFKTPKLLAQYLLYLDKNDTAYNEYFRWKDTHDYCYNFLHLSMQPWRAVCKKLNSFKGEHKVYETLRSFLHPGHQCRDANWKPNYIQSVQFTN